MAFSAAALAVTAVALAAACLASWTVVAIQATRSRAPLIPWTPRSPVPWALVDLLAVIGLYVFVMVGVTLTMQQLGWLPKTWHDEGDLSLSHRQGLIAANTIGSVVVGMVGVVLVAARSGATVQDLGFPLNGLWPDLRLGVHGFVLLGPPVYALQGVLVYFWKPSAHPLMEMFKESPDAAFFAALFVSAAVVAPVFEELMFRVLLQGFLETAVTWRGDAAELFIGPRRNTLPDAAGGVTIVEVAAPLDSGNPYAPPPALIDEASKTTASAQQPELRGALAWAPIVISSAIFAILHYSHGPDWIPLFFLACGMGYLYQRTHRIIPSLTVHVLLNSLSMWALWVQVHTKDLQH